MSWTSLESGLGVAVAALGLLVLVGWAFDIMALKNVLPGWMVMKANTAVAFLACGLALTLSSGVPSAMRRWGIALLAVIVALIGGLSFLEQLFSLDFGIDELLFRGRDEPSRIARPGRMSPATAYCFGAVAGALLLAGLPERLRLQLPLAAALSAAVATIGALVFVGHISNNMLGFRWGAAGTMAFHTAFAFFCLGVAGLLRVRRRQASAWALGRAGTTGLLLGVGLTLVAAELAASYARDMETTTTQVMGAQQTLRQLQELRSHLHALESAQRAYLMLADESLVEPREATKALLRKLLLDMGQAPPGDVPVPTQLQALREAIELRQTFGDHLIAVRRAQGFEAARDVFATGEGIALSARITSSMAPMALRAHDRLVERERHLAAVTTTTFLLLPIGSFLGLTALLAGLFFLDHGAGRRRQADESLARTQARLRVVFDSMAEGIRVVDAERNIVQMNRAGAGLHGLIELVHTLDAMHAQVDGVLPDGRVLALDEWPAMRALRGDFVRHCEMMFRRKDTGHTVFVELNTAPLPFEPGEPRQVVITSHDVSARKHAEADAREGRDRLEKVVENLTEGLMVHGLTGDFVHWNHAAQTLYELPRATATGMTIADFQQTFELFTLDGQGVPFGHWPMARLMRGELVQALELRVRRVGPDWERVFSYGGARVQAASGAPLVFLTVTDVTARKAAELQLRQLTTELEQRVADRTRELVAKTRELETFCYSVSHDLKAPLRGIDGYSRLLSDAYGDKLDADGRQFIANVRAAAAQMNQLIEDLLAYSQLERRTLVPARIRLRALVEEQVARSALELGQARVSVEVADVRVLADRDGLAIALRNLIDNALKFSAYSQPPVIEIRSHQSGKHCVLSVKDNGTGFDMRYHGKIFEIFQRLQRAEDFPGTGIGLALVRKAMERMGGRVWAESQPGTGATFYLELESAEEHDTVDTTY